MNTRISKRGKIIGRPPNGDTPNPKHKKYNDSRREKNKLIRQEIERQEKKWKDRKRLLVLTQFVKVLLGLLLRRLNPANR